MENEKPIWETFEITRLKNFKKEHDMFPFQQYATYLSLVKSHFVSGLQTGLGKTICAYSCYYYYKEKYPNTKLIVLSNKTAILQMEEQLYKFFHVSERGVAIHNYMDSLPKEKYPDTRKRIIKNFKEVEGENQLDILWMSYPIFRINIKDIEKAIISFRIKGWHLFVIYDESTAFMNMNTKVFRAVRKVSKLANKVCSLTATLSKGKLDQIYSIFKAMNIPLFPRKEDFMNRYCLIWQHPKIHYIKKLLGYQNVQELVELIRPYVIVFRKVDVAKQLPGFTINKTYIEHSEEQIKFMSGIYSGQINVFDYGDNKDYIGDQIEKMKGNIETNFIKMALLDERTVSKVSLDNEKILSPKTKEIIRALGEDYVDEKIIIYTHSKRYLKLLAKTIRKHKDVPKYYKNVLEIHGDINSLDREKHKNLFSESKEYNLLILNKAGIEALNLQAANTIIITTLPESFGALTQLAGRISRLGSIHNNLYLVYLLTKDSQDEDEYKIIMQQGVLLKNILGEAEEGLIDYSVLIKDKSISKEEYQMRSLTQLILSCRKRRAAIYKRKLLKWKK